MYYMHKQVIVVRSDVKMSKGKTAAQSAHASVSALDKVGKAAAAEWKKEGQKKVVLKVSSLQEGIDLINACPFANTTSIFTSSGRAARQFQYEVHPSMIGVNIGVPAPMSFFSFGGTRKSLYGDLKAHGKESIAFFTDTKVSIIRWF